MYVLARPTSPVDVNSDELHRTPDILLHSRCCGSRFLSTKCRAQIANQNADLKRIVNTVDTKVKDIDDKMRNLDMEDNNFKQKMREFQDEIRKYADSNPIWNAILRVVTSIRRLGFRLE